MQSNTHNNYQELEKGIWIITGDSDLSFFLLEAEPASILPILSLCAFRLDAELHHETKHTQ